MSYSRRTRRFVLLLHVLSSVSWIGVDLVIGVLSFTGLTTGDPRTMATAYTALHMFCVPLLLTLGLLSLGTGVLLSLGTRYGLVRYWWVAVKLVITIVLTALVIFALRPTLIDGAAESAVVDATLPERLELVRMNMIFPPLVSTSALLFTAWLGVYKPWGPTRYGRRFLRVPDRQRA
ncbi:MAG: DUF2269 family protein [Carbonactinosporaceae bacterium]